MEPLKALSRSTRRFPIPGLVAAIAICFLFPFKTTVVPEWRIRVVDETRQPFAGARVPSFLVGYWFTVIVNCIALGVIVEKGVSSLKVLFGAAI